MVRVVLVHGAFNELWGPNELRARWVPALRDGLWHHGVDLADADVDICFYGDLFRARPGIDDDQALDAARRLVGEQMGSTFDGPVLAKLDAEIAQGFLDRTIDLVARLVAEPGLHDGVLDRLGSVVGADTRVVVAHSLGTIVANRALCAHPEWPVRTFVTLGSPLGSPLIGAMPGGTVAWPGGIERWVNIAAVGDRAADPARLSEVIDPRIEDHLVSNGRRAHDPEPYLNADVTGAAIASALGLGGT